MMKKSRKLLILGVCILAVSVFICGQAISGEQKTITGQVNNFYQIVTDDNQIYEIGDNEKGEELGQLEGKRVSVTGTVEIDEEDEESEVKLINVITYKVLEQKTK